MLKAGVAFWALALALVAQAGAQEPKQGDLSKHDASLGDQYEPSLDVLPEGDAEAHGSKLGVPEMNAEEFYRDEGTSQ